MKCSFFFSGFFFGSLLILLGISIIIKIMFGIELPVFRMLLAGFLIWLGISMLTGRRVCEYEKYVHKAEYYTQYSSEVDHVYNIGFGSKNIDLTSISTFPTDIHINGSFSSIKVRIPKDIPTKIMVNSVSSSVKLPNGDSVAFGNYMYKSHPNAEKFDLVIHANIFCGSLKIQTD
jgi:hypothetical protein